MTNDTQTIAQVTGGDLSGQRVEKGTYVARNERGGQVRVGPPGAEGAFTPGELLHLAIASCAALSADHALASRLGEDFDATLSVEAARVTDEERYTRVTAHVNADMSQLDPERQDALVERANRAIDRLCTVGRTVRHGAQVDTSVVPRQRRAQD